MYKKIFRYLANTVLSYTEWWSNFSDFISKFQPYYPKRRYFFYSYAAHLVCIYHVYHVWRLSNLRCQNKTKIRWFLSFSIFFRLFWKFFFQILFYLNQFGDHFYTYKCSKQRFWAVVWWVLVQIRSYIQNIE